jgi:spore germination protein KB
LKLERITQTQVLFLFTLYFIATIVGFSFGPIILISEYDTWIVMCLGGLGGIILTLLYHSLAIRRPNEYFVHYGKTILPTWLHVPLMVVFIFFFLHLGAFILREFEDFMVQTYLPSTPNAAVGIIFGFVIVFTVRLGIETLFRTAQGLFFLIIAASLIQNFFVSKEFEWGRLMAFVTNHQLEGVLKGSYLITPWFGEIVLILFFYPLIAKQEKTFKSIFGATLFSLLMINLFVISLLLLFGPKLSTHMTYPSLEMVRFISIAGFIENLDPLLIAIWSTTVFLKVSIIFYVANLILAQLCKLKDYRPLTLSLGLVMLVLSLKMAETTADLNDFFESSWATFAYFVELIPAIYLLVDTIKLKLKQRQK